jgi:hypothetical protein
LIERTGKTTAGLFLVQSHLITVHIIFQQRLFLKDIIADNGAFIPENHQFEASKKVNLPCSKMYSCHRKTFMAGRLHAIFFCNLLIVYALY